MLDRSLRQMAAERDKQIAEPTETRQELAAARNKLSEGNQLTKRALERHFELRPRSLDLEQVRRDCVQVEALDMVGQPLELDDLG